MAKFYILSRKIVAIIGFIITAAYVLPGESGFNLRDFLFAVLWFIGALFTWRKKVWATILLSALAVYNLFRIIPDFKTLRSDVQHWSADFDLAESTIFTVGITVYSIATGMLLCVLSYGIYTVVTKWNKRTLEM